MVDVTPLSLGIEMKGEIFAPIIPRNTNVPCSKSKSFTTTQDYQSVIEIPIYEGERKSTLGNNLLGEFEINNIESAKMGVPQIEVTFTVDTNGILTVSARDKVTGSEASTNIANNRGRLSQAEIEKMLAEAKQFAAEDKARVERTELRNELETIIYRVKDRAMINDNKKALELCKDYQEWLDTHENASTQELLNKKNKLESEYILLE